MKINCLLSLVVILVCSLSACNKKDDKPAFVDKYFQVEQFLIDGADSTLAVKNKPHYAYVYFVNDIRRTILANGINYVGSAGSLGVWSLYGDKLHITINGSQNPKEDAFGPYWSTKEIAWTIINQKRSHLYLETDYEGRHYVYKLKVY